MKKSLLALAVAGAFVGAAQAAEEQKSVTLYGVIDAALRYTSNSYYSAATGKASGYQGFSQGLFNGSRFGLKGSEDLGNGLKAIYTLEAGVILGTGVSDQQGQLMGRQSWAGLQDDKLGTLTAGRQYGNFSGAIGTGDVFGELHGNMVYRNGTNTNQGDAVSENGYIYGFMGYRWDNSLLYANKIGNVKFSLMHAYEGAAGTSGTTATMNSVAVGYVSNAFNITGGFQTEKDASGKKHDNLGVGANFMYGEKNGVYAFFLRSKYDIGFSRISATNSEFTTPTLAAGGMTTARQDTILSLSANYYATQKLNLIGQVNRDNATAVAGPIGTTGTRTGLMVVADYYLSKDTDTYAMLARTNFTGNLVGNAFGGNDTGAGAGVGPSGANTLMLGMRHRF